MYWLHRQLCNSKYDSNVSVSLFFSSFFSKLQCKQTKQFFFLFVETTQSSIFDDCLFIFIYLLFFCGRGCVQLSIVGLTAIILSRVCLCMCILNATVATVRRKKSDFVFFSRISLSLSFDCCICIYQLKVFFVLFFCFVGLSTLLNGHSVIRVQSTVSPSNEKKRIERTGKIPHQFRLEKRYDERQTEEHFFRVFQSDISRLARAPCFYFILILPLMVMSTFAMQSLLKERTQHYSQYWMPAHSFLRLLRVLFFLDLVSGLPQSEM